MAHPSSERWLRPMIVILLVLVLGLWWWIQQVPSLRPAVEALGSSPSVRTELEALYGPPHDDTGSRTQLAAHPPGRAAAIIDTQELLNRLHAPDGSAEEDLQIIQSLLALYREGNDGANPLAGLNEEFTDAMRGWNPRRIAVVPADLPGVNGSGQLLDRWGTPYYFHPVARDAVTIRSAGPDRKLWTADDVIEGDEVAEGLGQVER